MRKARKELLVKVRISRFVIPAKKAGVPRFIFAKLDPVSAQIMCWTGDVIQVSIRLVYRPLVHRQRGFVHGFGERRVRVDDAGEVFGRALERHRDDRFGDQF